MSVLLLNASYEPIHVITERRAITLVIDAKAELVEQQPGRLRSATCEWPIPAVVRLVQYVKIPYRARVPLNRRAVIARDKGVCAYCGGSGNEMDHVIPRSRGGEHTWENVVCSCRSCNSRKADRLLSETTMTLNITPHVPVGTVWTLVGKVKTVDPKWHPYLADAA